MVPMSSTGISSEASSTLQGGTITSSLAIGIGWKTYRNQLFGIEVQYPIELVIGREIKPNTESTVYLWLPTGNDFFGF